MKKDDNSTHCYVTGKNGIELKTGEGGEMKI